MEDLLDSPWFWKIVLAVVAWIALAMSRNRFRLWNMMRKLKPCPIAAAYNRPVEIHGRSVAGDKELVSPLSKKPAVYYEVEIERYEDDDWETVYARESKEPFYIEDSTGRAKVIVDEADLEVATDFKAKSGHIFKGDFPPHVIDFLKECNLVAMDGKVRERFSILEVLLEPGEDLYILGFAVETDKGTIELNRRSPYPFIISDRSETRLKSEKLAAAIVAGIIGTALLVVDLMWIF